MADKKTHGTDQVGDRNAVSKLRDIDVVEIKMRIAAGNSQSAIAAEFGVTPANISSIATDLTWSHVVAPDMSQRRRSFGEKHAHAKLTVDAVVEIRARAANGIRTSEIAVAFGVSAENIRLIVRRVAWSHVA